MIRLFTFIIEENSIYKSHEILVWVLLIYENWGKIFHRKRSQKFLMEQLFPLMLHKNAKDRFNFEDCRFTMTRAKESTGRIVFWNMGITNSFTLEASYGGSNKGHKAYTHFNIRDYQQLGRYWCETLVDVCDPR